jgi:flagellar motor switch protein FliG
VSSLTPQQRAAVIIAQLSEDRAHRVLRQMSETEVITVLAEIARLPVMSTDDVAEVIDELFQHTDSLGHVRQGGTEMAEKLLRERLGPQRAAEIIERLHQTVLDDPLRFITKIPPAQLTGFLSGEHPQTLALVLAHINPESAAHILERLEEHLQAEVARRVAKMGALPPEIVQRIANELEVRLSAFVHGGGTVADINGISAVVEMLNFTERATEKQILAGLELADPDIAEQIRNEMFVFDDVLHLEDAALQLVLRQIPSATLAVALKGKPEPLCEKFTRNISERAASDLEEDISALGPQRLSVVESAESAIVKVARQLAEAGEITVARAGDELVS